MNKILSYLISPVSNMSYIEWFGTLAIAFVFGIFFAKLIDEKKKEVKVK